MDVRDRVVSRRGAENSGQRWGVLAAAVLGTALAYMSDDMLNLAMPSVARDLHASTAGVQWILNAYYVPLVAFVLVAGSLGDVFGHRRVFSAGLVLFGGGALLCAAAPGVGLLITGRAVQGVAAAMLLAAGLALVTVANPGVLRGRAVGRFVALAVLAVAVGVATFLVRLVFPFASERYVDLNVYQWPECVALFALGVIAARSGWLTKVPVRLRTRSRTATLAAAGGFAVFVAWGVVSGGLAGDTWMGGWHVEAFMFAVLESTLAVFGPVWLLGIAQRHLDRTLRWAGPAVGRSAYGAFIVQGLVLIGLVVALRSLPLAAEVKAVVVAVGGVTGSFGFAWLLITRVPGMARIL